MFNFFKSKRTENTDHIDGGVKNYDSGADSPKVILSENISAFRCKISFIAAYFEGSCELDGRVYEFDAELLGSEVKCSAKWYDRTRGRGSSELVKSTAFLKELQKIVSKHRFAGHNGYVSTVSGLPCFYGAMIDIEYESGEKIYAKDNQNCFISIDAAKDLIKLFEL